MDDNSGYQDTERARSKEQCCRIGWLSYPLITEKLLFGCALFSNVELDRGMIQKTIITSFATYTQGLG